MRWDKWCRFACIRCSHSSARVSAPPLPLLVATQSARCWRRRGGRDSAQEVKAGRRGGRDTAQVKVRERALFSLAFMSGYPSLPRSPPRSSQPGAGDAVVVRRRVPATSARRRAKRSEHERRFVLAWRASLSALGLYLPNEQKPHTAQGAPQCAHMAMRVGVCSRFG